MKFIKSFALLISMYPAAAFAGGWVSGGGELHRDAQNPWFLTDVLTVKYCLIEDEANFGVVPARASALIKEAIAFWKAELVVGYARNPGSVGTQDFVEQASCDDSSDIRFQLGVLTPEQRQQIQDPTHFVALSIRTDYDEDKLRGKGFVYVAPEFGALAPTGPDLAPKPWEISDGALLKLALMHELGHVFGIGHIGGQHDLMSEGFVEGIVSVGGASYAAAQPLPHIFRFDSYSLEWWSDAQTNQLFGAPSARMLKVVLTREEMNTVMTVYAKPDVVGSDWARIGEVAHSGIGAYAELETVIHLYDPKTKRSQSLTPYVGNETWLGLYRSDDGQIVRQISMYINPSRPRITAVLGHCLIPNIYSPFTVGTCD